LNKTFLFSSCSAQTESTRFAGAIGHFRRVVKCFVGVGAAQRRDPQQSMRSCTFDFARE